MTGLRELRKEQTRKQILRTALALFEEKGYVATTVDEIAAQAGTTRMTFYARFPGKRDVMRALIDELNELLERHTTQANRSTAAKLVEAVQIGTADALKPWLAAQAARWPTMKPYILVATQAAAADPEIRELYAAWFEEVIGDMVLGMTLADRHDPATRHFRGYLAMETLDRTALHWMREPWDLDSGPELDLLTETWVTLLGERPPTPA
jgi:AcrR family transcriptional regulator